MTQKFTNNGRALLTAGIIATDTSIAIEVAKADSFPIADTGAAAIPAPGKDWFKAVLQDTSGNIEIIYVRTRAAGVAVLSNVIRGQEGTTALIFAAGSVCGLRLTALDHENAQSLVADATAAGKALLNAANAAAQRLVLGFSTFFSTLIGAGDAPALRTLLGVGLRNHRRGLRLSNNVADATNDIDIAAGEAADSTNVYMLTLSAAMTKRLDAGWTVGTGNGGLDTGAVANGTYHVFLIRKDSDGSIDVLFSTSPGAPTMPVGYTYKRRIGSILRESAAIVAFKQIGIKFLRGTTSINVVGTTIGTLSSLFAMAVPDGIQVEALLRGLIAHASATPLVLVSSPDETDQVAAVGNATFVTGATAGFGAGEAIVRTSTGRQVRAVSNSANTTLSLGVYGWIDINLEEGL